MTTEELMNLTDAEFRLLVNRDLRSEPGSADSIPELRTEEVIDRWIAVLRSMKISAEAQIRAKTASNLEKTIRFKSGVEEALIHAQLLYDQMHPGVWELHEQRDALSERVAQLEYAIRHHQEETLSPGEADHELWKLIA